ncbi:MAG: hypothetical protein KDH93_28580 [Rhodoferax sp.]|nr:hypothetical protein [Rhodoferax sp.]
MNDLNNIPGNLFWWRLREILFNLKVFLALLAGCAAAVGWHVMGLGEYFSNLTEPHTIVINFLVEDFLADSFFFSVLVFLIFLSVFYALMSSINDQELFEDLHETLKTWLPKPYKLLVVIWSFIAGFSIAAMSYGDVSGGVMLLGVAGVVLAIPVMGIDYFSRKFRIDFDTRKEHRKLKLVVLISLCAITFIVPRLISAFDLYNDFQKIVALLAKV